MTDTFLYEITLSDSKWMRGATPIQMAKMLHSNRVSIKRFLTSGWTWNEPVTIEDIETSSPSSPASFKDITIFDKLLTNYDKSLTMNKIKFTNGKQVLKYINSNKIKDITINGT